MITTVRQDCVLSGKKYKSGHLIADADLANIKSANLQALFTCGYLALTDSNTDSDIYIANRSTEFGGVKIKRGEKIDSSLLAGIDSWRIKAMLESGVAYKVKPYKHLGRRWEQVAKRDSAKDEAKPVYKHCTGCESKKELSCFAKDSKCKDGLRSKCKACGNTARKKRK